MFAAVRLRAGWLAVGTALGLAGCAAMPTLPQIDLAMPTLPGFGPPPISAAMEPVPLGPVAESRVVAQPVSATAAQAGAFSAKPAFFVQWKPDMTGMTRRPRVDTSTPLPKYPESAMRSNTPMPAPCWRNGRKCSKTMRAANWSSKYATKKYVPP